jgi:hypothetical protein
VQKKQNFHAKTQRRKDFAKKNPYKVKFVFAWPLKDFAYSWRLCVRFCFLIAVYPPCAFEGQQDPNENLIVRKRRQ